MPNMSELKTLSERLAALESAVTDPAFLKGEGLGNELGFFIFDFEPKFAPRVEAHVGRLKAKIARDTNLRVLEINLFDLVLSILESRGLLERGLERERQQGSEALFKAVAPLVRPEQIRARVAQMIDPLPDLIFLTGVGAVWPLLRSHTVLNNLHELIDRTPLVMFFPGEYDGQELRLLSALKDDNYYRAFPLLPRSPRSLE